VLTAIQDDQAVAEERVASYKKKLEVELNAVAIQALMLYVCLPV
jgi:hypothetical protein